MTIRTADLRTARPLTDHGDASELLGRVLQYLPGNYSAQLVKASTSSEGTTFTIRISGSDHFGWTLDEYVLPRLASGNLFATEVAA